MNQSPTRPTLLLFGCALAAAALFYAFSGKESRGNGKPRRGLGRRNHLRLIASNGRMV